MINRTVRIRTVEVAGVTLRYRESGDPAGRSTVLLHGGASSAATWDRLAGALVDKGRHVIAPDLRGHGGSSRTAAYPLTGFRDDIVGLLDALALKDIALVGHSLGELVTIPVGHRVHSLSPERFLAVVVPFLTS